MSELHWHGEHVDISRGQIQCPYVCYENHGRGYLNCALQEGHKAPHMNTYEACGGMPYNEKNKWELKR